MNRYEQIISACSFSEEMERYLIGCKHNDYEMIEIILGAPLPLTEKRNLLELLDTPDSKVFDDVSDCIREFDDALAALELKETSDSITEIAQRCGFSDGNYFKDCFRRHFGCSPRAYRE